MCKPKVGVLWVSIALMEHILSDKFIRKKRNNCTVMRMLNREKVDTSFVKETVRSLPCTLAFVFTVRLLCEITIQRSRKFADVNQYLPLDP